MSKPSKRLPPKDVLIARAEALGYTVRFVEFVEGPRFPSVKPPGNTPGLCDYERREILVSTRTCLGGDKRPIKQVLAILLHEIDHAEGKDRGRDFPEFGLKCGGRVSHL